MHTGISRAPRALKTNLPLEKNKSTGERESEMDCDHTGGAQPVVNSVAGRGYFFGDFGPQGGPTIPLHPGGLSLSSESDGVIWLGLPIADC